MSIGFPGNDDSLACIAFYNEITSNFIISKKLRLVYNWFLSIRRPGVAMGKRFKKMPVLETSLSRKINFYAHEEFEIKNVGYTEFFNIPAIIDSVNEYNINYEKYYDLFTKFLRIKWTYDRYLKNSGSSNRWYESKRFYTAFCRTKNYWNQFLRYAKVRGIRNRKRRFKKNYHLFRPNGVFSDRYLNAYTVLRSLHYRDIPLYYSFSDCNNYYFFKLCEFLGFDHIDINKKYYLNDYISNHKIGVSWIYDDIMGVSENGIIGFNNLKRFSKLNSLSDDYAFLRKYIYTIRPWEQNYLRIEFDEDSYKNIYQITMLYLNIVDSNDWYAERVEQKKFFERFFFVTRVYNKEYNIEEKHFFICDLILVLLRKFLKPVYGNFIDFLKNLLKVLMLSEKTSEHQNLLSILNKFFNINDKFKGKGSIMKNKFIINVKKVFKNTFGFRKIVYKNSKFSPKNRKYWVYKDELAIWFCRKLRRVKKGNYRRREIFKYKYKQIGERIIESYNNSLALFFLNREKKNIMKLNRLAYSKFMKKFAYMFSELTKPVAGMVFFNSFTLNEKYELVIVRFFIAILTKKYGISGLRKRMNMYLQHSFWLISNKMLISNLLYTRFVNRQLHLRSTGKGSRFHMKYYNFDYLNFFKWTRDEHNSRWNANKPTPNMLQGSKDWYFKTIEYKLMCSNKELPNYNILVDHNLKIFIEELYKFDVEVYVKTK